jgi:hypothetical protein
MPSREETDAKIKEIRGEFFQKVLDFERKNSPGPSIQWIEMSIQKGMTRIFYAPRKIIQHERIIQAFVEPLRVQYATKAWEVEQEYFKKLIAQKGLGDLFSYLSPISMYGHMMSGLSRTDVGSHETFVEMVRRYRSEMMMYFASKKIFSSLAFFTVGKEEDFIDVDLHVLYNLEQSEDPDVYGRVAAEKAKQALKNAPAEQLEAARRCLNVFERMRKEGTTYKNFPALDLRDFPRFTYRPEGIAKSIQRVLPDIALLIMVNLLFFMLAFRTFLRYDPG